MFNKTCTSGLTEVESVRGRVGSARNWDHTEGGGMVFVVGTQTAPIELVRALLAACESRGSGQLAQDLSIDTKTLWRILRGQPVRPGSLKRVEAALR